MRGIASPSPLRLSWLGSDTIVIEAFASHLNHLSAKDSVSHDGHSRVTHLPGFRASTLPNST
jgi:hypothetical protein